MEKPPDRNDHVPPSAEVRQTEYHATVRQRIRHARVKHLSTWYGLGIIACALFGLLAHMQAYWVMPWLAGFFVAQIIYAHTSYADRVYQSAYAAGVAMGILSSTMRYEHALEHVKMGEEPCEQAGETSVPIPHVWEHEFVREEIRKAAPSGFRFVGPDDDEDDDSDGERFNHRRAS